MKLSVFSHDHVLMYSDVSKEDSEEEDDDEDDDEDSSDDDADGNDEEAVKPASQSEPLIYTALSDFKGEQEGDLSVQVKYFLFYKQRNSWRCKLSILPLSSCSFLAFLEIYLCDI